VRQVRWFPPVGPPLPVTPCSRRLQVFSVEATAVQLTWSALGPGAVRFQAANTSVEVEADGGPGAVMLTGLPSGTRLTVVAGGAGVPGGRRTLSADTLDALPGHEVYRFATIGDLHVGAAAFGFHNSMPDPAPPEDLHPLLCTRHALDEAVAWGAQRIVAKGDLTHDGRRSQWRSVAGLLDRLPDSVPVDVLPGNHDWSKWRDVDPTKALIDHGRAVVDEVEGIDLPGLRLVLVDSAVPGLHGGRLTHRADAACQELADAARSGRPAMLVLHHQLQRSRLVRHWPPGVGGGEAGDFLERAVAANPNLFVTSGHTHRHRRRTAGPVTLTTVGSTKDHPGVWAGYVVHEAGIQQVVRRVADPRVLAWTERTGAAIGGLWRHLSPGRLDDRCLTVRWP